MSGPPGARAPRLVPVAIVGVLLAAAGLALGLPALVLWSARRRGATPKRRGPATTVLATLAVIALLGAGTEGAVLAARGTGEQDVATPPADAQVGDVVVLPETSAATAERTADLVRARSGRELQGLTHAGGSSDISSTTLLVDPSVWHVVRTSVLDPPTGTDHRGFEAVLRPVDS